MKIVTMRVSECAHGHDHRTSRVRSCSRCGEPCWVSPDSLRLIAALGTPVECSHCAGTPGLIVLVRKDDFWPAVAEAKRYREARRAAIVRN